MLSAALNAHKMHMLPDRYFPDQGMQNYGCFSGLPAVLAHLLPCNARAFLLLAHTS